MASLGILSVSPQATLITRDKWSVVAYDLGPEARGSMPTVLERIDIEKETIGHVLRDRLLFVPIHQRSYAWEEEHVTDLYTDLAKAISDENPEYFLGSLVIVKSEANRLEVNDGQQRLATSAILIGAIRDYFLKTKDNKTATLIEERYLLTTDIKTLETTARLRLNAEDHDFFAKRILLHPDDPERKAFKKNKPVKQSHRRIAKAADVAAKHVANIVSTVSDDAKADELHKWIKYIDDGARVIWVQVADGRTAYFIFETMNDRGLKLSAADLLKNHILAQAADREDEAYQRWNAMSAILETLGEQEDAIVNYIRQFWIANNGPIRTRDLYDAIKTTVKNKTTAINLAVDLATRANDYVAILTSSHETWATYDPSVRKQVDTLSALGVQQMRPLLLAAMRKFSKAEIPKLFQVCISWSARYLLASVQPGGLEHPHGNMAKRISSGDIKTVKQLTALMLDVIPNDERFKAAVATANVSKAHLARYYLRAMQMQEDGEKEPQYVPNDGREVTLEHILPENPGDGWKHIPPDVAKAHYKRLGNQVLLAGTVNSKLGNASYIDKKPALTDSPFSLTNEAAAFDEWNIDQVAKHQERLAELAVKTWPIKFTK